MTTYIENVCDPFVDLCHKHRLGFITFKFALVFGLQFVFEITISQVINLALRM